MTSPIDQASNYFDLHSLNNIKLDAKSGDKASKEQALTAAAKQFEAIFMQMLLKSMRKAQEVLESDSPFNSQTTKFYRDMHDQQLALEMSNNGSLGLSELIVRQLGGGDENFKPSSVLRSDANLFSADQKAIERLSVLKNTIEEKESNNRQTSQPFKEVFNIVENKGVFAKPEDFVQQLTEPAKQVEEKLGIPFSVVIAQAALETGWGKKIIQTEQGESSNNLFNIKADSRWQGDKVNKETLEFIQGAMVKKKEPFRVYENLSQSINDYIDFLSKSPRYQAALEKASDVEHFVHGLQKAGYATDPRYAEKVLGTLKKVTSLLNL